METKKQNKEQSEGSKWMKRKIKETKFFFFFDKKETKLKLPKVLNLARIFNLS